MDSGRVEFNGPELNLAQEIERLETEKTSAPRTPPWQLALQQARLPLYDVHWEAAIVTEKPGTKKGDASVQRGIAGWTDHAFAGKVRTAARAQAVRCRFCPHDTGQGEISACRIRVRPTVQGAAVVIENKTGRILAMAGGFSYPLSQLNRVTQSQRQPGSALKPLTYLAALQKGLQPNTFIRDEEITLPPINGSKRGLTGRRKTMTAGLLAPFRCEPRWKIPEILQPSICLMAASLPMHPQSGTNLRPCARTADLQTVPAILSLRSGGAARKDDRPCGLLCNHRQ